MVLQSQATLRRYVGMNCNPSDSSLLVRVSYVVFRPVARQEYLLPRRADGKYPSAMSSMWLNVDVQMSPEGVIFITLSLPVPTHDLQKLEPPYRVDNNCSIDRLLIRQSNMGPSAADIVPCCAAPSKPIPCTFALDKPTADSKELMIQARPVGVASLFYWADGRVGEAAMASNWDLAAKTLESVCLGAPEVR